MKKIEWCFADAMMLALDEKERNPKADFSKLVKEFWKECQAENIQNGFCNDN